MANEVRTCLWCERGGGEAADGRNESRCGWFVDRFGVSWQIVPRQLPALIGGADPEGAKRATEAMMGMAKIEIATLERAYEGR